MYRKMPGSLAKHIDFLILDLLCLIASLYLGFYFRQNNFQLWQQSEYRSAFFIMALVHVCIAIFTSNYQGVLYRGKFSEFISTCKQVILVMFIMLVSSFFMKTTDVLSRLVMGYTIVIAIIMMYIVRSLWKMFLKQHLKRDMRLMLLISDREGVGQLIDKFKKKLIDVRIAGLVLVDGDQYSDEIEINGVPIVASLDHAVEYLKSNVVDEVFFGVPSDKQFPVELLHDCKRMGLTVHLKLTVPEGVGVFQSHEDMAGISVLSSYVKEISMGDALLKRGMDIIGGIVGLIITGIVSIFVAPMIYIADPGPIFFSQKRVGMNGRIFKIYKFRSMYQDAEERKKDLMKKNEMQGLMFKMEADPRVIGSGPDGTKHGVGHFIRSTSLDEFPQFWNVLKGDMSLVGTRPPTLEEYEEYDVSHHIRLAIKPGITGLWQISGRSEIKDFEDVVKLDTEYIENWSILSDIKILVKTVAVVVLRKGAS